MKKICAIALSCLLLILFTSIGFAQQTKPVDNLANSPYVEELKSQEPFGGVANALEKLDELNDKGEYGQSLQIGLMLIYIYYDYRVPIFLRSGRSLVGMGKWKDSVEAYTLTVDEAVKGARIHGVTEPYMQDAEINLAALYVRKREEVPAESLKPMNKAREIANRVLAKYPDNSFSLLADHRAMRHAEAVLLLTEAEVVDPTDKAKAKPVIEKLEALIPEQSGERVNVRTKGSVPYSTLALDCWWKVQKAFGIDGAQIEPLLKTFEKDAKDTETRALASILLGKLNEEIKGTPEMATAYYKKGLSYNIFTEEQPLCGYMKEASAKVQKKD